MKVSIIGTGYVGLVTGACLADRGHEVICVDVEQEKIDKINAAISPIHEEGLAELLRRNAGNRLIATSDHHNAVLKTDVTFITVGTPCNGNEIDLTYLKEASRQVAGALAKKSTYHLVVVKSTVVPGTTDNVVRPILESVSGKQSGLDFGLAMNPEFLTEGEAVHDFLFPDRIILGGIDAKSTDVLEQLYSNFEGVPRLRTNTKTAEMTKYASNALLATMISFSNEIANLCSALGGIDAADVMQGLHHNQYFRVTLPNGETVTPPITAFLWAGCGFGGSCLPKDVKALIAHGEKIGRPMPLLKAVIQINERQTHEVLRLLQKHFPSLHGVSVAVLGLAFRPGTNDIRESPAVPIIHELAAQGVKIKAYDPVANRNAKALLGGLYDILFCDNLTEAITSVDAVVLVTRWEEFKGIPDLLGSLSRQPVVIDGRRMLGKNSVAMYEGVGL